MSFKDLPSELILDIVEQLEPQWSFNFAISCKVQYKSCQSILKHHTQQFFECQTIGDDWDARCKSGGSAWAILRTILDDPRKGWYIKEIKIPGYRRVDLPYDDDRDNFKRAARALADLYPVTDGEDSSNDFFAKLEESLDEGFDDAIIAILIHHLPSLEIIKITDAQTEYFLDVMFRLAVEYKDSSNVSRLPLQRLKTATITHWDTEGYCDPDWACCFLCIPSLQTFAARNMGDVPSSRGQELLSPNVGSLSNVTELFFVDSVFDLDGLYMILKKTKTLKKLTYTGGGPIVCEGPNYAPKKIIECVSLCLADSLEELVLNEADSGYNVRPWDDMSKVSLQQFSYLKTLNCYWSVLCPHDDTSTNASARSEVVGTAEDNEGFDFGIKTVLPASLERLYIHGDFADFENGEWEGLTRSLANPQTALPNLKEIWVQRIDWETGREEVFGDAKSPPDLFDCPPGSLINAKPW